MRALPALVHFPPYRSLLALLFPPGDRTMNALERRNHRRHLTHLLDAARELDENIQLEIRELAKFGDKTLDARVSLTLARSGSAMSADRLDDAIRRLVFVVRAVA